MQYVYVGVHVGFIKTLLDSMLFFNFHLKLVNMNSLFVNTVAYMYYE